MTDANGLPLWQVVAGANTHDIKLVEDTLDALQTGRPGRRLHLCMDKGCDAEWLEICLKARLYEPHIQSSREKRSPGRLKKATSKLIVGLWKERIAG